MKAKKTSACLILGGLGVAAVIAGFAAEATETNSDGFRFSRRACYYPRSSPAYVLGICAMVILCIIQIVFNVTTGCACCCRRKSFPNGEILLNSNPTLQMIFLVVSWMTFVAAFVLFLLVALYNALPFYIECNFVKPVAVASLLTLICAGCGIGYINLVFKAPPVGGNMNNGTEGQFGQPGFIPVGQRQQQYGQHGFNAGQPQQQHGHHGFIPGQPQQQYGQHGFIAGQPQQQYGQHGFIPGQPQQQYGELVPVDHKQQGSQPAQYPPSNQLQPYY